MSFVTELDPEASVRRRIMVPKVPTEDHPGMSTEDAASGHTEVCDIPDYNKKNTTVIDSFKPKTYDGKELQMSSWVYDSDGLSNEVDSRRSLIDDEVIVHETKETMLTIALQVFVPFLIAGFGTVGAGLVLDMVQASFCFHVSHYLRMGSVLN